MQDKRQHKRAGEGEGQTEVFKYYRQRERVVGRMCALFLLSWRSVLASSEYRLAEDFLEVNDLYGSETLHEGHLELSKLLKQCHQGCMPLVHLLAGREDRRRGHGQFRPTGKLFNKSVICARKTRQDS